MRFLSIVVLSSLSLLISANCHAQVYESFENYPIVEGQIISQHSEYELPGSIVVVETEQVAWVHDYDQARKLAMHESKPLLLFLTADGCHYCEMMRRDVFGDRRVVKGLKDSFVAAKLKIDPQSELAQKLQVTLFPTTVIIDSEGNVMDYARGYRKSTEIHDRMMAAVSRSTRVARK